LSRPASDGPEISVVIPTRNRWSLLSRTLTGALEQIDVDHEVVVVDDGSTDETPLGLTDIGDPRLRVVRHESGRGLPAARNSGISAARGRWVAFLDDDDLWSPVKLRLVLDVAGEANADFAYSAGLVVDQANQVLETWPAPDPAQVLDLLLTGNWIPAGASNSIAQTGLLRRLGGFDEGLDHFADWDMWIRLAAEGPIAASPEPLVARVLHPENMVLTHSRHAAREFRDLVGKHRRAAESYGVTPDRVMPDTMGVFRWLGWAEARRGRRARAAAWYLRAAWTRSPYGRRQTVRDAVRALAGEVPPARPISVDPDIVQGASWLERYERAA